MCNMNATRDYHTKQSYVRKRKTNIIQYQLHLESKYDTNELIYKTETDSQTRRVGRKVGAGCMEWEFGISKCKLLLTAWIRSTSMPYRIATRSCCIAQGTIFNTL